MDYGHMCGHGWFFFPGLFFFIMIICCFIMMRRGHRFCGWRGSRSRGMWGECWNSQSESYASAMDILKKRYAAGEITKEEFDQMKKEIKV